MAESRGAIARLVDAFAELPGIGRKTAERLAYHVLRMPAREAIGFAEAIRAVKENLRPCGTCFNLAEGETCDICSDPRRDRGIVCVVEQVRDLLALEQAGSYRGLYHVLQGRISPLEGVGPEKLTIDRLVERVRSGQVREVIMGTSPNVEGDATALVVTQRLQGLPVEFTRLARGLTVGASLEQANREMLADAISGRQKL
ncbi:MAG: recombination protein RecR [Planctomycetia bacterium]|nr:recombination protein RecR [Planctomycetia bacterium]